MQLTDLYKKHFGHKTFDSVEDYYAELLRYTSALSNELNDIYRYAINSSENMMNEFDITILNGEE